MGLTISNLRSENAGSQKKVIGTVTFDASYATGGEQLNAKSLAMSMIEDLHIEDSKGYAFDALAPASKAYALIKVYRTAGFTPAGSIVSTVTPEAVSAGTPAGTITGALELATPAFSGTGYATAGQVTTTTDNQTMTLNQCAGMWFMADGLPASPAVLILSNTAVTGAPAVLTCNGVPPVTDAGTYKIVTMGAATFVGSALATHSHASTVASALTGTPVVATSLVEVADTTDLSALVIDFVAYGK